MLPFHRLSQAHHQLECLKFVENYFFHEQCLELSMDSQQRKPVHIQTIRKLLKIDMHCEWMGFISLFVCK